MPNRSSFTEGPILSALLRLAVPIVLANILQTAYQLTDTFWVGRLSAQAVAAVSLVFPINFLLIAIGGGLPMAGTVLIAQYRGRDDPRAESHVAGQTLLMSVSVATVLAILGLIFATPIMRFIGAGPDVLTDAVRFLQVTLLGFVFVFGFFAYQALMRGLGIVQLPMYIVLLTVLLNFVLDPLFIFGWGPVPAMGVAGAAIATACTQALAMAIGLALLFRGRGGIQLRWRHFRPDPAFMWRLLRIGFPTSMEQSTRGAGLAIMMLLVSSFGTMTVAAYGIGTRIMTCVVIPAMGLSIATSALVAQNIGAERIDRAEKTARISSLFGFVALELVGIAVFLGAYPLAEFFMPAGADAIDDAARFLRIVSLTFGFIGMQQVLAGTLRGAGDMVAPMLLAIVALWVLRFPLAFVLSRPKVLGTAGIWWAFPISNVISAAVTGAWFTRSEWQKRRLLEEMKPVEQLKQEVTFGERVPF